MKKIETFCFELKKELAMKENGKPCCRLAELYGMALFSGCFKETGIKMTAGNLEVAKRFAKLCGKVCDANLEITATKNAYTVSADEEDSKKIFTLTGHSAKSLSLKINFSNFDAECCSAAFLRGVFLVCGFLNNPENEYYLEFDTSHRGLSEDLFELLALHEVSPKKKERGGKQIIYIKKSTDIEDFLTIIGASGKAFELMDVKILKEMKNRQNRLLNFEVANLSKTVEASRKQCEAIEKIKAAGLLEMLPKELSDTAMARLENPELPLSEIAEMLTPKPTRSGLNHRLTKLINIAKEL